MAISIGLVACGGGGGGGSDVGSQDDATPIAVAQILGASSIIDGTVPMRSGGDAILTGKESDGIDDPIHQFNWRQVDSTGISVDLIERSLSSRSFTAPSVSKVTEFQFELTVVDSEGVSGTDSISVSVQPVADADSFLAQDGVNNIAASTFEFVVAVEPGETTNSMFSLDLETVVTWVDRTGQNQEMVVDRETINGEWPEGVTGTGNFFEEFFNPRYVRPLPVIDVDEINKFFEGEGDRDKRLETSDIDQARIFINFIFDSFDNNARVVLQSPDGSVSEVVTTSTGQIESGRISVDDMRATAGSESSDSAAKYFALVDAPATLSEWLARSGFDDDPENQAGVTHAKYLKNYDLGFGRDMYIRVDDACGNVYSFVGNYASLEDTILNRGNFATVVMEYSPVDGGCGDGKFVKFYNYVPDEKTGENVLVKSMNFDGRGEKFLPGVCTACHGGSPNDLSGISLDEIAGMDDETRRQLADLDTSFMLWDLDSFLYADNDPALTPDRARVKDADRQKYSRASQENAFRAMNKATLRTYVDDPERYAASIKLVHGWYGSYDADSACQEDGTEEFPERLRQLPAADFDGSYVQCGWRGEENVYDPTYARNCRMCHTQLANTAINFDTANEFLLNGRLERLVYQEGLMPLARLTYDRFWVEFDGNGSGGDVLAARLGLPADTKPAAVTSIFVADPIEPDAGGAVRLDGSGSLFADAHNWTLQSDCGDDPSIVGSNSAKASFVAGESGCTYDVSLEASNEIGSDTSTQNIAVADPFPVAVDFVAPLNDFILGDEELFIEVLSRIEEVGDGDLTLVVNETDEPFNLVFNPNVSNNNDGSLSYFLDNPFGVQDEIQYQLTDANGTLAPTPGLIMVALDPVLLTLIADGAPKSVTLTWTFPDVVDVDGFRVYRGSSEDDIELLTTVDGSSARTFRDAPLDSEQTFIYQVSAFKGEFESQRSSAVEVKTIASLITGVRVVSQGPTQIGIAWDSLEDAVAYQVQRNGVTIARVTSGTFFLDAGLASATAYSYRIIGEFEDGSVTTPSSTLVAQTLSVQPPATVTVSAGDCTIATQVIVSWTQVAGNSGYVVSWSGGSVTVPANTTAFTVSGIAPNAAITVQVQTIVGSVISAPNQGSATSCISWAANIFPALPTCSSGGCHAPVGAQPPAIGSDVNSVYSATVSSSCLISNVCGGTMIGIRPSFSAAGGDIWISQGAKNN